MRLIGTGALVRKRKAGESKEPTPNAEYQLLIPEHLENKQEIVMPQRMVTLLRGGGGDIYRIVNSKPAGKLAAKEICETLLINQHRTMRHNLE
jgi:hypothetical protein